MRAPDFWKTNGGAARLLDPLGRLYGLAGRVRRHWVTPKRAGIPVICIGNLTVGGTGKTPTAIAVGEQLKARGARPHMLTRGYRGRERGPLQVDPARHDADAVGDEPLLLARSAPTWVSRDRVTGAAAALAASASHIVMDDGLQNPYLAKDFSLVVVDGAVGFGNRRLLPAGPLREPIDQALSRIDAVVLIGADRTGLSATLPEGLPVLKAILKPDNEDVDFRGRRVLAFAGIGRPDKFYETLVGLGAELVETRSFPDHHRYRTADVDDLLRRARQFDAACITTEKDHVRLAPNLGKLVEKLPVHLHFHELERLDRLLSTMLPERAMDII